MREIPMSPPHRSPGEICPVSSCHPDTSAQVQGCRGGMPHDQPVDGMVQGQHPLLQYPEQNDDEIQVVPGPVPRLMIKTSSKTMENPWKTMENHGGFPMFGRIGHIRTLVCSLMLIGLCFLEKIVPGIHGNLPMNKEGVSCCGVSR